MTEPITLTDDELDSLGWELECRYGSFVLAHGVEADWQVGVRAVINKLNELRAPLPVGTVRADDDGNIAVKVSFSASDSWFIHRTRSARCSGHDSDEYVADWPIVHKPE